MRISMWRLLGAQQHSAATKKKLGIVALLYLVQGAPAAILWEVLPVYFRLHGVSLRAIGGLRLLELPYSLKVFWSPLVHRYGDRRMWVATCMLGIAAVLFALPFVDVAAVSWIVLLLILCLDHVVGNAGCRHRLLLGGLGRSRRGRQRQRRPRIGLSGGSRAGRGWHGFSRRSAGVESTVYPRRYCLRDAGHCPCLRSRDWAYPRRRGNTGCKVF